MCILSDKEIREYCLEAQPSLIENFVANQVSIEDGHKVISYGLSSFGYDVTLAEQVFVFPNTGAVREIDPRKFDVDTYGVSKIHTDLETGHRYAIIPPNGFVLGHSVEYFNLPRNISAMVLGKSTYARAGVVCIATPLEAGWRGQVTLEFANTTPVPVRLYVGQGCAQVQFFAGKECEVSYADRGGKYQGQVGVTLPKV